MEILAIAAILWVLGDAATRGRLTAATKGTVKGTVKTGGRAARAAASRQRDGHRAYLASGRAPLGRTRLAAGDGARALAKGGRDGARAELAKLKDEIKAAREEMEAARRDAQDPAVGVQRGRLGHSFDAAPGPRRTPRPRPAATEDEAADERSSRTAAELWDDPPVTRPRPPNNLAHYCRTTGTWVTPDRALECGRRGHDVQHLPAETQRPPGLRGQTCPRDDDHPAHEWTSTLVHPDGETVWCLGQPHTGDPAYLPPRTQPEGVRESDLVVGGCIERLGEVREPGFRRPVGLYCGRTPTGPGGRCDQHTPQSPADTPTGTDLTTTEGNTIMSAMTAGSGRPSVEIRSVPGFIQACEDLATLGQQTHEGGVAINIKASAQAGLQDAIDLLRAVARDVKTSLTPLTEAADAAPQGVEEVTVAAARTE